ncbi:hypothetical protein P1P91_05315 [Halomonas piscis]|uniref:DUF2232 domain-containing protein n=1 Tax=Halomonas piscis TaxID=3031727 RepID=A0ABY9Z336_9GAMM|nr:hypothetical protein [Halomonas piscis]WNK21096.1 hypothetical protein P1P91_05315 [Halomonas piscis]
MLAFARWLMQRPSYAAGAAVLASLVPWLFWLGAAIAALVTLRKGFAAALPVILAAAIPAGWWWTQGDVVPLSSILLATLMSVVLRERMRWSEALIVGTLACAAMVQLGIFSPPGGSDAMLEQLRQNSAEFDRLVTELGRTGYDTSLLADLVINGVTGLVVILLAVACLALARSWQAGLYNPGGFRQEFHALRLTPRELALLVGLGAVSMLFDIAGFALVGWVPLLIAGVALVHGIIGLKEMNGLWLGAFYLLLITTWPMILIVLLSGLIDSFANVRARLARSN